MPDTVLITGSGGFIGRALTGRLMSAGDDVIPFSKSLGNDLQEEYPFRGFLNRGIRLVFHCAAVSSVPPSWESPSLHYQINTQGTQKVAEFCRQTGAYLIYLSTYTYGSPQYLPVNESHPVAPHNPYAHSKWLGEEICRFYGKHFGLKTAIVRPFNIYGPGQSDQFVIPAIVRQWVDQKKVTVENLNPKRDFLFVDDCVDALLTIARMNLSGEIYNVGYGQSISVNGIIDVLEEIVTKKIARQSLNKKRPVEIDNVIARCRLVDEGLWKPVTSFIQGLSRTLEHFLEQQ